MTGSAGTGEGGGVLLYDGGCGFCEASVALVLRHDRRRTLRFGALGGAYGTAVRAQHAGLEGVDSVVWVEGSGATERVFVRSDAALRIARYLGGWWALLGVFVLVPRVVRDGIYGLVARNRHRLARRPAGCLVPTEEERGRFLP